MLQKPKIIFNDPSFLILDKPTGWIVNDAESAKGQDVVQLWLKEKFDYPIAKSHLLRSGIVHRLDKETSGLLIVAKTESSFRALQKQFKVRVVKKTYVGLAHGVVEPGKGLINAPVGRLPWNRRRFGVMAGGRNAVTGYEVIDIYGNGGKYSLLKLSPKTGRTHQLRIHLKYLGHPLVSDTLYAGRKTVIKDKKFCPRLFLHAWKISFINPRDGKEVNFDCGLPKDLKLALSGLEKCA